MSHVTLVYHRYGQELDREFDTLDDAVCFAAGANDAGEIWPERIEKDGVIVLENSGASAGSLFAAMAAYESDVHEFEVQA